MYKKHLKGIVTLLAGITLGSSVIGSGISVVNASEKEPMSQVIQMSQKEDMSKYYTKTYNPKTNITTVTVSDRQYVQYLLDHGVKEKDIPTELRTRSLRSFIHVKWYGRHRHGNLNFYVSARALRCKDIAAFVMHFALSLFNTYKEDYVGAVGEMCDSIKDIADGFHTHRGREYMIRHWRYAGSRVW